MTITQRNFVRVSETEVCHRPSESEAPYGFSLFVLASNLQPYFKIKTKKRLPHEFHQATFIMKTII
jgi:hypothetical protein